MDIGQDILNTTPLGPLQTSLLEHISKLISFGESLTRQRIQIFTPPLLKKSHGNVQQGADMLCIERSETGIVTHHLKGNHTWHVMMENGQPLIGEDNEFRQHVFPVVDNGGRIIGGISFTLSPHLSR
nr:hypothetical protein [Veillonella rogosae]